MVNYFGTDGIINPVSFLFGAIFVIGALIFRKSVANDMMERGFSVVGSSAGGIIAYIIMDNLIGILKYSVVVGLIVWAACGFLLAEVIGDGEAG